MRTFLISVTMVMCMMMVSTDVTPQTDFDLQRFTGRWYQVGLAYDSPRFVPYRDKIKASMGDFTALTNGDVNLTIWDATPEGCVIRLYYFEKTPVAGEFTFFSTYDNMVKDVTVVDTNYTEYVMVVIYKVFDREYTQVALYSRSQTARDDIIQKFKDYAVSLGFPIESIVTPPPAENCPAAEAAST